MILGAGVRRPAIEDTLPATVGEGAADGFHAAWVSALEELELDVATAEAQLAAGHLAPPRPWVPKTLGPLPEELAVRARRLLQRQLDVSAAMAHALQDNRRQLALLERIESGRAPRRPAYVDQNF